MWQRKQTIYLLLTTILMVVVAIYAEILSLQIFGGFIAGVSLADIFVYKNRKQQMLVCVIGIILLMAWVAYFIYDQYYVNDGAMMRYPLYAMLPVVCIILFGMARKGIKHDDDLVKSMDRIR